MLHSATGIKNDLRGGRESCVDAIGRAKKNIVTEARIGVCGNRDAVGIDRNVHVLAALSVLVPGPDQVTDLVGVGRAQKVGVINGITLNRGPGVAGSLAKDNGEVAGLNVVQDGVHGSIIIVIVSPISVNTQHHIVLRIGVQDSLAVIKHELILKALGSIHHQGGGNPRVAHGGDCGRVVIDEIGDVGGDGISVAVYGGSPFIGQVDDQVILVLYEDGQYIGPGPKGRDGVGEKGLVIAIVVSPCEVKKDYYGKDAKIHILLDGTVRFATVYSGGFPMARGLAHHSNRTTFTFVVATAAATVSKSSAHPDWYTGTFTPRIKMLAPLASCKKRPTTTRGLEESASAGAEAIITRPKMKVPNTALKRPCILCRFISSPPLSYIITT